jgi:hypothetical protein
LDLAIARDPAPLMDLKMMPYYSCGFPECLPLKAAPILGDRFALLKQPATSHRAIPR